MLNINFWNIAFTIINILVLYLFLKHFLMKPVMAILEERKQMVEKELDEAAVSSRDADLLKKKYELSLENAKAEDIKVKLVDLLNEMYKEGDI